MANQTHVALLQSSIGLPDDNDWNNWRQDNPGIRPDLVEARLIEEDLSWANLQGADLRGAILKAARLGNTDLSSADLREAIERDGHVEITLDLAPGRTVLELSQSLAQARGKRSIGEHLRRAAQLDGVRAGLVFEFASTAQRADPIALAGLIKHLPLRLLRVVPKR